MKLFKNLTIKNLKLNKKRTIVTIIGIILSVALITALASLIVSFKDSSINYEIDRVGNYHIAFGKVNEDNIDIIKKNRNVENYYLVKSIGYAKLDESKNENKPYAYLTAFDFKALDNMGINLIEGRLPQTSDEIVIPRHLKTNGRITLNVGDTVTLDVGKRVSEDYELNQNNPYNTEDSTEELYDASTGKLLEVIDKTKSIEELVNTHARTYKIVGIIERPSYEIEPYDAPGYTFITCLDKEDSESTYDAYIRFKKDSLKNYYTITANMLNVDENLFEKYMTSGISSSDNESDTEEWEKLAQQLDEANFQLKGIHSYLIDLEYIDIHDASMRYLYTTFIVVSLIIMVASVFCIKNSFDISITEKTKQYGMLSSVGATKRQIKKSVLYEAYILGLIGIPLGIIGGLFAAFVLIKVCSMLLMDSLNMDLVFSISILAIIVSIVLGAVTIYLSAIRSARKASKISPISAIRNSDDIKIKSRKVKSPKVIKKLFGIGGDVSYKNLKRNKKKYRTTVISIIVCVSIFIALSSFMTMAFKTIKLEYTQINHNISVHVNNDDKNKTEDGLKSILELDGINGYTVFRDSSIRIENPNLASDFKKEYKYYSVSENDLSNNDISLAVVSLGDSEYRKYIKKLGLRYDDVKKSGILINNTIIDVLVFEKDRKTKQKEVDIYSYKVGDTINAKHYLNNEDDNDEYEDISIKIAAITHDRPLGLEGYYYYGGLLVVSDEYMKKFENEKMEKEFMLYVNHRDPDKFQDEVEKILETSDNVYITNFAKEERQTKSLFTLIGIFLYGFITVIALIGITNIFNTITTNMELRSREFATLKSVGMTTKEFNRMIRLESLFYGVKSLVIGIPIGCLLSYLIFKNLVEGGQLEFAYTLPYKAIIISTLAVFILISCIMKFSLNKISKQNIIETIRNDNI